MSVVASAAVGAGFGLAAAPHCLAMCGPVAAACGESHGASVAYGVARLAAYAALGALVGGLSLPLSYLLPAPALSLVFGGTMALALLLAARNLVRAAPPRGFVPIAQMLRGRGDRAPIALSAGLGLGTALLPCGALHIGLLAAAGTGTVLSGAVAMASFAAVGALPLAFAGEAFAKVASFGPRARRGIAWILVLGAVLVIARPLAALLTGETACHG
jgi:sulfite exporter TauE/SafE